MKLFLNVLLVIVSIVVILGGCYLGYNYFTKEEDGQKQVSNDMETYDTNPIFTINDYPKIDGSTSTIPLSEAFIKAFTGNINAQVKHNKTHNAYLNLINGDADIILVTSPSEEELEIAKQKGIELEVIPVVNEAFVFYVNEKNPVKSLTLEQIQKIYSGEITNWKQVGGEDAPIIAYQRQPNSGSQTGMLDLVMKDIPMMKAPKEQIIKDMASIVDLVSDYDNGKQSIGYSYYYYATTMYEDIDKAVTDRIKFLGVNGIQPNDDTIINNTYPLKTSYYIVINKDEKEDSNVRKLVKAMLSDWGQDVVKEAGYVPLR